MTEENKIAEDLRGTDALTLVKRIVAAEERLNSMAHEPFNTPEELMQDLIRENSEFTKTIVRLRGRERVLVDGDDSVLSQAHIALCWVQEKMPQFYPDMIQRIKKQCGIALDEYEARAALATPAPEQPSICPDCRSVRPSSRGLLCDAGREWRCDNEWHEKPAQPSAEKAG